MRHSHGGSQGLDGTCPAQPTDSIPSSSGSVTGCLSHLFQGPGVVAQASKGGRFLLATELEK